MLLSLVLSASAFDHSYATYQTVLSSYTSGGKVDYAGIKANPANLNSFLTEVASADISGFSSSQKMAFYINAYNALTLDLIADSYPINSIMDLDGGKVWDTRKFKVANADTTLNGIENGKVRPMGDPRIHAALNCSAKSCPPLAPKAYLPETLSAQLDSAVKSWVATTVVSGGSVSVSKIFDWYGDDFLKSYGASYFDIPGVDGKAEAALNFISKYAPDKASALKAGNLTVTYLNYDWALNRK
jgi:hypothetical protein